MNQNYSWVADVQRQVMAQKLANRGMPSYNQRPISERYGVSYTGQGPDGEVDKSAPAGMDFSTDPPHIFHQGETRLASPMGGAVYLNADVSQSLNPAAFERWQAERGKMQAMEGQLPGFASGGLASSNPDLYNKYNTMKQTVVGGTPIVQPPQTNTNMGNTADPVRATNIQQYNNMATTAGKAGSAAQTGGTNSVPGGIQGGGADTIAGDPMKATKVQQYNNMATAAGKAGSAMQTGGQAGGDTGGGGGGGDIGGGGVVELPSERYLREAENYTKPDWGRDAEGTRRIADMRQEAASAQAYQQHQQAMRGTDANAAWAQNQMLAASKEAGINNFAAEYARGIDERNWNRLSELATNLVNSGDPAMIAQGAMIYNDIYPGAGIDFSGFINAANASQYEESLKSVSAWVAAGLSDDEVLNRYQQAYGQYGFPTSTAAALLAGAKKTDWDFREDEINRLLNSMPGYQITGDMTPEQVKEVEEKRAAVIEGARQFWLDGLTGADIRKAEKDAKEGTGDLEIKNDRNTGDTLGDLTDAGGGGKNSEGGGGTGVAIDNTVSDARQISDGKTLFKNYDFEYNYNHPVYEELLENGNLPTWGDQDSIKVVGGSKGSMTTTSKAGRSGGTVTVQGTNDPGIARNPAFDSAWENNTPIVYNDVLYYVDSARAVQPTKGTSTPGYVVYTLKDPLSKSGTGTETVTAKAGT